MSIYTKKQLASILHIKPSLLDVLANQPHYRPYVKTKILPNGKTKERLIDNPGEEIKSVQAIINRTLLQPAVNKLPPFIHGARPGIGITASATLHAAQPAILALDIANCFPSINSEMVYRLFRHRFGYSHKVATLLTRLTTFNNHLPQGSPTSPSLCNLILAPMSEQLFNLGQSLDLRFSQYVDDLYYSGKINNLICAKKHAINIVHHHSLHTNSKTHITTKRHSMVVAGAVINQKVSAGRPRIRQLERQIMKLHSADKFAYLNACRAIREAQKSRCPIPKYKTRIHSLQGKIANVTALNSAQGQHLKQKLTRKLASL